MFHVLHAAALVALGFGADGASSFPACPDLTLAAGQHCAQAPTGVVIAQDPETAIRFAQITAEGEAGFRRYFGRAATGYAVLIGMGSTEIGTDGVIEGASPQLHRQLKAAGARRVLPWITEAERERLSEASARRSIEAHLRERGLSGDALEAALAASLEQTRARRPVSAAAGRNDAAVAHELGHMWFTEAFWPVQPDARSAAHYGGAGPDWLDEVAAILMEDEQMTAARRNGFRQALGEDPARIKPLRELFDEPHPMAATARSLRPSPGGTTAPAGPGAGSNDAEATASRENTLVARVVSGEEAARMGADMAAASLFYAQNRVVADFLLERSGSQLIFAQLAGALADGASLDDWLAEHGRVHNLPSSVSELEIIWEEWVQRTYAAG